MSNGLVCGCVRSAEGVLDEVLSIFSDIVGNDLPYLSLERFNVVAKKYGEDVVALILSLLDRAGYVEHSGNLTSSSWLTREGVFLRESLTPSPADSDADSPRSDR